MVSNYISNWPRSFEITVPASQSLDTSSRTQLVVNSDFDYSANTHTLETTETQNVILRTALGGHQMLTPSCKGCLHL